MTTTETTITESPATTVEIGDFFYSSWGYDQTNVDFFEVVSVSASGKTIKIQECRSTILAGSGGPSESVVPLAGSTYGDKGVETKRLKTSYRDGTPCRAQFYVASYASAYLWDGTPKHQTGIGWGH